MEHCLANNKNIKRFLFFIRKKYYSLVAVFKIFNAVYNVSEKKDIIVIN